MIKLLLRWVINASALLAATQLIHGFIVETWYAALVAAAVLGLLNALVRPILFVLTLPLTVVTLGLFSFVINGLLMWFMSSFVKGVSIAGFWPALMAALFVWAVSVLTGAFLHSDNERALS